MDRIITKKAIFGSCILHDIALSCSLLYWKNVWEYNEEVNVVDKAKYLFSLTVHIFVPTAL